MQNQLDCYLEELSDISNSLPQSRASSPGEARVQLTADESHFARQSSQSMPAGGERQSKGQNSRNYHSRPNSLAVFTHFPGELAGEFAGDIEEQDVLLGSPKSLHSNSSGVFHVPWERGREQGRWCELAQNAR